MFGSNSLKMVLRGKRRLTKAQDGVRQCKTTFSSAALGFLAGVKKSGRFIVLQCLQLLAACQSRAGRNARRYPQTIRRIYDISIENTGNITGLDIKGADTGVMIQKTDADGAVLPESRSSVEDLDRLGNR